MEYENIISQMTLDEKAMFVSGKGFWETVDISRLGIPSIFLADGPHGIRKQAGDTDHLGLNKSIPATCFPTAAAMANSWNLALAKEVGMFLGKEAKAQGVNVLLGPGLNIKRSPLCGRNFEYFSEDPYLAGKMAAGMIQGIQSEGVAACPKHFAVNSQELRRMSNDSILDERTLREIYTTGFEIAVKEGKAMTIMSSYNKVNGTYANENKHLLRDILVDEWGFDGFVVSDWGASNDHAKGVLNGSHLEMPTTGLDGQRIILNALKDGTLTEEVLDMRISEMLRVIFQLVTIPTSQEQISVAKHHEMAQKAAEECIVLLKNEDNILPLNTETTIALIGDFADKPRYQGAGSSQVNSTVEESTRTILNERKDIQFIGYEQGYQRNGKFDSVLQEKAIELAKKTEIVILYLGLGEIEETEGMDRNHIRLNSNQIELLIELFRVNKNIIVVLSAGCVIEMPWMDKAKAIIHGSLTGQAGARAMIDIIFGMVNPSGRLAETYPCRLEDNPCYNYYPGREKTAEYREGIYVGYRYYETVNMPVTFPFGFGLSYTNFEYSNLEVCEDKIKMVITNSGTRAGAEVIQMYIALPESKIFRPVKELKGFCKVFLEPKESKHIEIAFDDMTFRYYNIETKRWEVEGGLYHILIGSNVRDIKVQGEIKVKGTIDADMYSNKKLMNYYKGSIKGVDDNEFKELLGHPIPQSNWDQNKELQRNDALCQMYYAKSRLARLVIYVIKQKKEKSIKKGTPDLNMNFICDIPFRGIAKMTGGVISMDMSDAILEIVNGHFFRGMKHLIQSTIKNRKKG